MEIIIIPLVSVGIFAVNALMVFVVLFLSINQVMAETFVPFTFAFTKERYALQTNVSAGNTLPLGFGLTSINAGRTSLTRQPSQI